MFTIYFLCCKLFTHQNVYLLKCYYHKLNHQYFEQMVSITHLLKPLSTCCARKAANILIPKSRTMVLAGRPFPSHWLPNGGREEISKIWVFFFQCFQRGPELVSG